MIEIVEVCAAILYNTINKAEVVHFRFSNHQECHQQQGHHHSVETSTAPDTYPKNEYPD
jgi:hypothetical protein